MKSLAFFAAGLFCVTFFISALRGEADASSAFRAGGSPDETIVFPSRHVYLVGSDTSAVGLQFCFEHVVAGGRFVAVPPDSMKAIGLPEMPRKADSLPVTTHAFRVVDPKPSRLRIKMLAWNTTTPERKYLGSHALELYVDGAMWPCGDGEYTMKTAHGQYQEIIQWWLTKEQNATLLQAKTVKLKFGPTEYAFTDKQWSELRDHLIVVSGKKAGNPERDR